MYYDENIGRDAASTILSYGDKHSFLIRARLNANDVQKAPYATDFLIFS